MSVAFLGTANSLGKCSYEKKLFKLKVSFDFYRVWRPTWEIRVRLCTCISEVTLECAYWSKCAKLSKYSSLNEPK